MLVNALVLNWKAKLAVGTVYNRVTHLRKILRILETYGAPPCAATLPNVKRTPPRTNIFDPQQIAAIISGSPAWLKLFTVLAWQLALRFSETFAVTPRSHNAEQQTITISTKGGKVRTIPTTPGRREPHRGLRRHHGPRRRPLHLHPARREHHAARAALRVV
jgi:integrase